MFRINSEKFSRDVLRRGHCSYDSWYIMYEPFLFQLKKVFMEEIYKKYPETRDYFSSEEFHDKFCGFVFEHSSGKNIES